MEDPKSQRIEELEKQLEEQKDINAANLEVIWNWERKASEYEQKIGNLQEDLSSEKEATAELCSTVNILREEEGKMQEIIDFKTAAIDALQKENKKLLEKLDVAERELKKANHRLELEINEKARVDRLYDEIKIKNANICSTIADMVRKIMIMQ